MSLIGQTVRHRSFGKGIIEALTDSMVTICFPQGEKKFIYPEAFGQFLVLKDQAMQKQIEDMLNAKKKKEEREQQATQDALDQIQKMRTLKITSNSQAAFDIKCETEDQNIFLSWKVSTGHYLSGYSKGEPRIPSRLKPNSACLLTGCPQGAPETDRRIIGVFMVKEDFFGDLCSDGIIEGHERYRISLQKEETMPFWSYFPEKERPQRWGSTVFRYFANECMQQILFDLPKSICGAERREAAQEFYRHFCKINRLPDFKTGDESEKDKPEASL